MTVGYIKKYQCGMKERSWEVLSECIDTHLGKTENTKSSTFIDLYNRKVSM